MLTRQSTIAFAAAAAVILLLANTFYTVDQRFKVLLFEFGEIKSEQTEPGLHLKIPFVQTVRRFDARMLAADPVPVSVTTSDQKSVDVGAFVKWRIADATVYYRAIGRQQLKAVDLLEKTATRALDETLRTHTLAELTADDPGLLAALRQSAAAQVHDLGIEIIDFSIRSVELPKDGDYTAAVYERMRAERARIAAEQRGQGEEDAQKVRAEADATAVSVLSDAYRAAERLRGEGDAHASEVYSRAYAQDPDFFAFYRSLAAYRDAFKDKRDVIVVEPRGEFFRYFKDPGKDSGGAGTAGK